MRSASLKHARQALIILTLLAAGTLDNRSAEPQDWTHFVRIGGYGLTLDRVEAIIRNATDTGVFGIETDNDIPGRYESLLDSSQKLKAIKAVAERAHAARNYAFVYIAGLECITDHADSKQHTFFKDHPDWVQRKSTGEPAVFGGGTAFWIAPGDEDVWISPFAQEWRRLYMRRVREISATGIDGIYVDIPYWMTHFEGWENSWASFDDYTVAAFKKKTGLNARTDVKVGDYSDSAFRRWIDFRIEAITDFMREINENVKRVNPQCKAIAEIYPGIEEEAPRVGADVYELYPVVDVIAHEYEFGTGNHMAASRTPLDWLGYMTGMYSFRSFAEGKASWILNYSWEGQKKVAPSEAMKNLAMAELMSGSNVWDARGHVMSRSNDIETRKLIFRWIADHQAAFYSPRHPVNPIGVYFSPTTRDYFPSEFVRSYRGIMIVLLTSHLEFQVVTPRTSQAFAGNLLILPNAKCLSSGELDSLKAYTRRGGTILTTGETGKYNELGEARPGNVADTLGAIGTRLPDRKRFLVRENDPGAEYYSQLERDFNSWALEPDYKDAAFERLRRNLVKELGEESGHRPAVEIRASPFVSTQIARVNGNITVFLANFRGLKSNEKGAQTPERNVEITFPASPQARIYFLPFLGERREIPGVRDNDGLKCVLPAIEKGAVVWIE
jgi:hypothetical protein